MRLRGRAGVSLAPGLWLPLAGWAWGGVMHGEDGSADLASNHSLLCSLNLSVTSGEITVPIP